MAEQHVEHDDNVDVQQQPAEPADDDASESAADNACQTRGPSHHNRGEEY